MADTEGIFYTRKRLGYEGPCAPRRRPSMPSWRPKFELSVLSTLSERRVNAWPTAQSRSERAQHQDLAGGGFAAGCVNEFVEALVDASSERPSGFRCSPRVIVPPSDAARRPKLGAPGWCTRARRLSVRTMRRVRDRMEPTTLAFAMKFVQCS